MIMASSRFFILQRAHTNYSNISFLKSISSASSSSPSSQFLSLVVPSSTSSSRYLTSNFHVSSSSQVVAVEVEQHQQSHPRSPDLVAMEYADLNLPYNSDFGHVRIRQHVNPLIYSFSVLAQVQDWNQVFADPMLPLMVDIGCGSGRFLMWLAKRNHKLRNYLRLEIRRKLVESYHGPLMLVSILVFVQSDMLELALDMRNQFDEVDALKHIDSRNTDMLCDNEGWLLCNPMGIRTEREIHAELEGAKIYRRLYQKHM